MKTFLRLLATLGLALGLVGPAAAQFIAPTGGGSASLVGGTTPITGTCSAAQFLFNNSGVLGCSASSATIALPQAVTGATSGGIPYFSNTTTMATSAALAANAIVVGGGAGATPATISTAAGIATWIGTPSSANLAAALTDETGTGPSVFATAPIFTNTAQFGTASTATGQLLLANAASANLTTIQAGNAAAARTYTWPTNFGAAGTALTDVAGNGTLSWVNSTTATIEYVIDGGGSALTTGIKGYLEVPVGCTITQATLLADQSGSVVVDVFKSTYSAFAPPTHPASGDKITASAPPTITTATKSQDSTLTGWTTTITAGDILAFNINSATTITRVTISLKVTKT